jgi:hypothetical protein
MGQVTQRQRWDIPNQTILKSCRRAAFAECRLTGRIFGDMLFQFLAPQGLERPAAAVQRLHFGELCMFAEQVAVIYFAGRHARVFCQPEHLQNPIQESIVY